jgi:hypothetical protein
MPLESDMAPNLDLKSSLTLRVVAVALFCFLIAAALALLGTDRDVRQLNEHVADVLVRQLQMRLSRIETSRDVAARFPDLDSVTEVLQSAGQRVQCIKSDGSIARSSCMSALPPIADSTQTLPELEKCHYSKHKPFKVVTQRLSMILWASPVSCLTS